jgi:CubicO group peptidase (beta-lactamase class C family)
MTIKQSTLIIRVILFVGTLVSLTFVPWLLLKAWILPLPDTIQQQLDEAISHGLDGIVIYVDEAGKAPAFYAAGWHERENNMPADPHALFKIGSINKLYVAASIAILVNDNRLSLDKALADYFPELVGQIENAEKITLKMMVQHRSGIPNYTDTPDYWTYPAKSFQDTLALIQGLPANFAPNADYEYSNTNYLLIAKLIEKTTGQTKFEFIQQHILAPLNLQHTFGSLNDVNMVNLMGGYHLGVDENIKTVNYGAMVATAEDVGIFLRALNDGSVFKQGGQEIYSSIYEYEHGGWIPGYQSQAKYYPDLDTVVIQFNNTTDSELLYWNLSEIIFSRIGKIIKKQQN